MSSQNSSPGSEFPNNPAMRLPALAFLYRLKSQVAKEIEIGAPHGAGSIRSVASIVGDTLKGPDIGATILPLGGADWATVVEGTHSMTLDARYTSKTTDGHHIYIQAHGLYRPGPRPEYAKQVEANPFLPPQSTVTQDDVEFFSHFRIEAGPGEYNWLNGLVSVGVMCWDAEAIWIGAYHLTNFEGSRPESVMVRKELVRRVNALKYTLPLD